MFSYSVEKDLYLFYSSSEHAIIKSKISKIASLRRDIVYKYQIYVIYKRRVFNTIQISNVLQTNKHIYDSQLFLRSRTLLFC